MKIRGTIHDIPEKHFNNLKGGSYIIYFARIPKKRDLMCDQNMINLNQVSHL